MQGKNTDIIVTNRVKALIAKLVGLWVRKLERKKSGHVVSFEEFCGGKERGNK
jgi:hypothetical protein